MIEPFIVSFIACLVIYCRTTSHYGAQSAACMLWTTAALEFNFACWNTFILLWACIEVHMQKFTDTSSMSLLLLVHMAKGFGWIWLKLSGQISFASKTSLKISAHNVTVLVWGFSLLLDQVCHAQRYVDTLGFDPPILNIKGCTWEKGE